MEKFVVIMQHISNQLNKVITFRNKKSYDIPVDATVSFLTAITDEFGVLTDKKVCIFGSICGVLAVAAGLNNPAVLVMILDSNPDEYLLANLQRFNIRVDLIIANKMPFSEGQFDIAIVGPSVDKPRDNILNNIKFGLSISKEVYALYPNQLKDRLLADLSNVEICGSIPIHLPGSSNYSKNENKPIIYNIIRIKAGGI